jgi:hypothetical protein
MQQLISALQRPFLWSTPERNRLRSTCCSVATSGLHFELYELPAITNTVTFICICNIRDLWKCIGTVCTCPYYCNLFCMIFVNNQLDVQFFFIHVYFYSLHVLGSHVPIIRRINCVNTTPGICHSV